MSISGTLYKMRTEHQNPVQYHLILGEAQIPLNTYLGKPLYLHYTGVIHCINCGRKTSKSFNQGYCYPCFTRLAQCDTCIIKPELCHFAAGTCREPAWGEAHCMQPHIVYLANSSGLKVGITRQSQMPTRWMDQGASSALPIMQVASRYISGLVEIILAQFVPDKTNWQQLLKGLPPSIDLTKYRDLLLANIQKPLSELRERFGENSIKILDDAKLSTFDYPILNYPAKLTALNFDKTADVGGTLQGIKGQYLMFDSGVINIRKYGGYQIALKNPEIA